MRDLISDSSLAVFEAAVRVKSTHLIKSMFEKKKKRKYGNKRYFLRKSPLKDRFN